MLVDHIGFIHSITAFRIVGRLAMPLYCMSFVMGIKSGRFAFKRLSLIALSAQPFYFLIVGQNMNIVFGFLIFSLLVWLKNQKRYKTLIFVLPLMLLPVEYGLYLYVTLIIFYCNHHKIFKPITFFHCLLTGDLLQIFSIFSLIVLPVRVRRMNKKVYRAFYPVHLGLLSILKVLSILMLLVVVGCSVPESENKVDFDSIYSEMTLIDVNEIEAIPDIPLYTFISDDLPLRYFVRWLSETSGASVITSEDIDERRLTASIKNQSLDSIIEFVSRRYRMQVIRTGSMYYIGDLLPEDKGVLVRKVRKLDAKGLSMAISNLLSEYGRCSTYDDGLCVVSDKVKVLNKVDIMLSSLESEELNSWVVQVYLISARDKDFKNLGLDTTLQAELSFNTVNRNGVRSHGEYSSIILSGLLKSDRTNENINIIAKPLFVIVDGAKTKFYVGESYPVAKKSVSDAGTVQTTGYEYIPVGLTIDVGLREVSRSLARISLSVELSNVIGFVDEIPITDEQRFNTEAVCQMQGVYLLGSLRKQQVNNSQKGLIPTLFQEEKVNTTIQVWAKLYRIKGPVSSLK